MRTAVFCYAPEDLSLAREIGDFLTANLALDCCYDEGLVRSGGDLLDIVGGALSAELAIVLLSPELVPKQWLHGAWQPVLLEQPRELGSHLVFALARECRFPALLRRESFCDLTANRKEGIRALKRLIFRRTAADAVDLPPLQATGQDGLEDMRCTLADRPGVRVGMGRDQAVAFAHACAPDFEGAFWIDCVRRTHCGVVGEMAHRLGLRLSGSFEQNRRALWNFCSQRRCLFVLEHLDASYDIAELAPGGLTSIVVTASAPAPEPVPLPKILALFANWANNESACLAALGHACHHLRELDRSDRAVQRLGAAVVALLKHHDRLAEANEVLEVLLDAARVQGDAVAQHRFEWERSWILGHWGEPYAGAITVLQTPRESTQLGFDFA